jgi:hypothetical protein|eukprot:COSAG06_NODE_2725_length_6384_cov_4.757518_2_plen_315_part_00
MHTAIDYDIVITGPQDVALGYACAHRPLLVPPALPVSPLAFSPSLTDSLARLDRRSDTESCSHHIMLQAEPTHDLSAGETTASNNIDIATAGSSRPGNVAIRGVKIHACAHLFSSQISTLAHLRSVLLCCCCCLLTTSCHCLVADQSMKKGGANTSIWLENHGWVGSLLYTNSQAEYCDACSKLNKAAPGSAQAKACKCYEVVQAAGTPPADFNLSLIGNAWWAIGSGADSSDYSTTHGDKGPDFTGMAPDQQVLMLGGIVDNWGASGNPWFHGNVTVPEIKPSNAADEAWRTSSGLDLFTKLGRVDLAINHKD